MTAAQLTFDGRSELERGRRRVRRVLDVIEASGEDVRILVVGQRIAHHVDHVTFRTRPVWIDVWSMDRDEIERAGFRADEEIDRVCRRFWRDGRAIGSFVRRHDPPAWFVPSSELAPPSRPKRSRAAKDRRKARNGGEP